MMRIIQGNFIKGFIFSVLLCIPQWLAFIGWTEIIYNHEFSHDIKAVFHKVHLYDHFDGNKKTPQWMLNFA